jgi:hypothetical protein
MPFRMCMSGMATRPLKAKYESSDSVGCSRIILCRVNNAKESYYWRQDELEAPSEDGTPTESATPVTMRTIQKATSMVF